MLALRGLLIVYEGVRRLIEPPEVEGTLVLIVALVGIPVNLGALRLISGDAHTQIEDGERWTNEGGSFPSEVTAPLPATAARR